MNQILSGAISGTVATGPMTAAMELIRRNLPPAHQYALPPEIVTTRLAEQAEIRHELDSEQESALIWAAHFGYGAAAGALYSATLAHAPGPSALKGVAFGLGVWAVSYMGWLPFFRLHPAATEESPGRNALLIGSHIVWGAMLGEMVAALGDQSDGAARRSAGE